MPALVKACMCLSKYDSETPWNSARARPGRVLVGFSTASRTVQWSAHSTPALIRMESRIFRVLDCCQSSFPADSRWSPWIAARRSHAWDAPVPRGDWVPSIRRPLTVVLAGLPLVSLSACAAGQPERRRPPRALWRSHIVEHAVEEISNTGVILGGEDGDGRVLAAGYPEP